jgi:S-formylglutathione hydrolase FrmB
VLVVTWWWHLSLLRGWLPGAVSLLSAATLGLGVAWSRRRPWQWVIVAIGAFVAVLGLQWIVDVPALVGSRYPDSFVVWAALPVFALGVALWQWPVVAWWRRAVTVAAVPVLAAFGGLQINSHYGYMPTMGDLFHQPLPGQVDAQSIDALASGFDGNGRKVVFAANTVSGGGVVAAIDIPATVSRFGHRPAWVWLPPEYFVRPRRHLPVLVLISGTPGGPEDWLRAGGALALANEWATTHNGDAPIMVLPDVNGSTFGDTECVDGPRGRAETYVSVDVRMFMETRFGAARDPRRWAIAGLSEGGTCALTLVARHCSQFRTFADFSGDAAPTVGSDATTLRSLYGGSARAQQLHDPTLWFPADAAAGVEGDIAVGSGDHGNVPVARALGAAAALAGLRVHVDVVSGGGHNFGTWRRALRDAFPWIVHRLEGNTRHAITVAHKGGIPERARHGHPPRSSVPRRA